MWFVLLLRETIVIESETDFCLIEPGTNAQINICHEPDEFGQTKTSTAVALPRRFSSAHWLLTGC